MTPPHSDPPARLPSLSGLYFAVAAVLLLLFQLGYSFETGDQLQYLLLPYRQLYPRFLPGDWFTWHTSHYHVTFAWIVRAVHALTGEAGFARGLLVVHCLNLAAFGYALRRLALALGLGWLEAGFALILLGGVRQMALGGALINHAGLVPADLALAPFVLACAACCEDRPLATGAYLGVSGFLHANYAVLGPLVLFPVLGVRRLRRPRPLSGLLPAAALFALFAAPTLWLIFGSFLAADADPAAVAVTLFVRSPHHYDLGSMRPDQFYFAAILLLVASPALAAALGLPLGRRPAATTSAAAPSEGAPEPHEDPLEQPRAVTGLPLIAALAVAQLVAVLGSGLHITPIARLFAWRMSVPLFMLLALYAGAFFARLAHAHALPEAAWFASGCAVMLSFAQRDPLEPSAWNHAALQFVATFACLLLGLLGLVAWGPRPRRPVLKLGLYIAGLAASALAVGIAWHLSRQPTWLGMRKLPPSSLHVLDARIDVKARTRPVMAMIRARTPHDARFLVPPGQNRFRLQARRSIFVDWKCAPMKGDEALEWKRRMLLAMGVTEFPARGYALPRAADRLYYARPVPELVRLARAEGMTHLLVRTSNPGQPAAGTRQLFRLGPYVVLELE